MLSSMDYYSLNKLFLSVEYKLYEIIAENFDCTIYCASTFWSGPDEHVDDCLAFFEMINEEYNTNFEPDSIISYYDVEEEIIRQDFIKYIEKNGLKDIDYSLFNPFFENPREELIPHILDAIKNGKFAYISDVRNCSRIHSVTVIQSNQTPDELNTTILISGEELGGPYYISAFPSQTIINSSQKPLIGMFEKWINYRLGLFSLANISNQVEKISFSNMHGQLQRESFAEGRPGLFLFWGIAYSLKNRPDSKDFTCVEKNINSLVELELIFDNFDSFIYNGNRIFKVLYKKSEHISFPVFVSERVLPENFAFENGFKIKLLVLICGQIQVRSDEKERMDEGNEYIDFFTKREKEGNEK